MSAESVGPSPGSIRRGLLVFALLGAVLLPAWPWVERGYGRGFVAAANGLLNAMGGRHGLLGSSAAVFLKYEPDRDPVRDIAMGTFNRHRADMSGLKITRVSARHLGYLPAATLAVLVLASPVPWRRRWRALGWGLGIIHGFVLLRLALLIVEAFHGRAPSSLFALADPWSGLLGVTVQIAASAPATTYLVPLVVWVAVTFRRSDFSPSSGHDRRNAAISPRQMGQ